MIILGTNSIKETGFDVANSCRFNSGSSDNLSISLSSTATNTKKGTLSFWFKTQGFNQQYPIAKGAGTVFYLYFNSSSQLVWQNASTNTRITNQVFRDPNAWSNIVVNFDTTQSTASNRQKMYFNGTEITSFGTSNDLSLNQSISIFDGDSNTRAISGYVGGGYWNGYMSEVVGIDGLQLDPTSFGEFDEDSGIWKPINVSGLTFGNNGFYLEFKESGTSANSSGLGADTSGNTHHFTVNNLTAIDQSTDTCTNNFATLNPLQNLGSNITYSDGNLTITPGTSDYKTTASTIAVGSGKWYAEFKAVSGHNGSTDVSIGIVGADTFLASTGSKAMSAYTNAFSYGSGGLVKQYNNSTIRTDATYTNGDIIGIAVDMDNLKLYWSKNGAFQNSGNPTSGATGTGAVSITAGQPYYICATTISSGGVKVFSANFGSPPYSESGGNSDGDGFGNFKTAPPSGYFALNTKNLAEYG